MVLADVKGLAWDVRKHPNADCGSDKESTLHEARHKLGRQRLTPWDRMTAGFLEHWILSFRLAHCRAQ
jgi:hypothetical protein